ncbi:retrovirus-related pol polyprotein from transposon TNT 1-94 [Tanacetum coccineum]
MKCPQHYLTDMQEVILFYNGLDIPTRQILDPKGAIPSKIAADAKIAIQEMAEYSQKWHNRTSSRTRMFAAQVGCELCKGPHYTKDCPQKEEGKTLEEAYYTQFGAPYQPGRQYRATGPGFYQRNNGNSSYPDRRPILEESLTKFMAELAKRHEENSNIIKVIRASTDAAIRNQGASIKTLEIQIGQMSKVLQDEGPEACLALQRQTLKTKLNRTQLLKLIFLRYVISDVVHTPYRGHNKGVYCLKQFLSQDDCKTSVVMIGERHKMNNTAEIEMQLSSNILAGDLADTMI